MSSNSHLSAIILDHNNKKLIASLLRTEFRINKVETFTSAKEAMQAIKKSEFPALVFIHYESALDLTFDFVKSALSTKKCEQTKFVLLAEKSNRKLLMKAASNGISSFILKPFTKQKFAAKVKKLLPKGGKPSDKRFGLLESVEATLRFKGKEITGGIEDISTGGCLIRTPHTGRLGMEIYDIVTIRVTFENEKLGVNGEVIRMEKDQSDEQKSIKTAFKFTKPNEDNALQFAKLWAFILKERESI